MPALAATVSVEDKAAKLMGPLDIIGQDAFNTGGKFGEAYSRANTPLVMAWNAIRIFLSFLGILVIIAFLYGGWMYMTSQGNQEKTEKAKKILLQAAIGTAVILASFSVAWFVLAAYSAATDNRAWREGKIYYEIPTE